VAKKDFVADASTARIDCKASARARRIALFNACWSRLPPRQSSQRWCNRLSRGGNRDRGHSRDRGIHGIKNALMDRAWRGRLLEDAHCVAESDPFVQLASINVQEQKSLCDMRLQHFRKKV
jgi:hypothetical protein